MDDFLELEELDKKYTMKAYLLTTGKVDMYVIDPMVDKEDLKIINKYYKEFGGHVNLISN